VTRIAATGVVAVVAALGPACRGADEVADDTTVSIEVEFQQDRWVGAGGAVEQGMICDRGTSMTTAFLDHDGGELSLGEFTLRWEAARMADPPDETIDFLLISEFSCSDGSGAFTLVEELRNGGAWTAQDGIGISSGLRGQAR